MHLTIDGLFGRFHYDFSLFENDSQITILTGPNGFGKSTILRCIKALSESDIKVFADLECKRFQVVSNRGIFDFERKEKDKFIINGDEFSRDDLPPFTSRVDRPFTLKFNINSFEIISNPVEKQTEENKNTKNQKISDILQNMVNIGGRAYMIQEQRLWEVVPSGGMENGKRAERMREVIAAIPDKLKSKVSQAANEYSKTSTELDSSLPYRLLNEIEGGSLTEEEFNRLYQEMNESLTALRENGISDVISDAASRSNLTFDPKNARILRILLNDFNRKYEVYRPLMKKLTLFQEIVNGRLTFKKVKITDEQTLIIEGDDGRRIPLRKLSSGEKEILVLFYTLIFETEKTMLLIDEPEISLHLAWQKPFVRDLQRVAEMNDLRAVLATHSSSIIGGHRDIQIDLGELYKYGRT